MARQRPGDGFAAAGEAAARPCNWPGCRRAGEHRAPLSRERLHEFQYLCLQHIREFNRSWDFFEGWKQDEIDAYRHADLSWHRPTWRSDRQRGAGGRRARTNGVFRDPFAFVAGEAPHDGPGREGGERDKGRDKGAAPPEERRALAVLGLRAGAGTGEIKRRFKDEVKACHPDVNGADEAAEARLREVIWAYRRLMRTAPA